MGKLSINLSDFEEMLNFEQEEQAPSPADNTAISGGGLSEMDFDQMGSFPNHKFKLYKDPVIIRENLTHDEAVLIVT